jgi:activator of HSP90 ATPase
MLTLRLLTIYDFEIEAKWKGTAADGTEVTGRLSIPEFSHETIDGLSDYVFNWNVDGAGKAQDSVYAVVRKAFPPVLTETLNTFRTDLLNAHGIFGDSLPASGTATPSERAMQSYSPAPPGEVRAKAAATAKPAEKVGKTATVEVTAQMHASADDLWSILTDANRIPMWSRSPAKFSLTPGDEFELFSGNVSGKIVSADKPTKLVQTWNTKSPGWPAGHYGTMTITLNQGSDSTELRFSLEGVPAGKEADIERALDAFYIRA